MSIFSDIEAAGKKIGEVLTEIVTFGSKVRSVYQNLSGPTLAASSAVFYDVVKCIAAAQSVAASAEAGNIPAAITLSETTIGLVKQIILDAKAGEAAIVADVKALNLKI